MISVIPIVYQGLLIISLIVRVGVAVVHSIGGAVDPLPPDQGPQVTLSERAQPQPRRYVSQIPHEDLEEVTVQISIGGRPAGSGVCVDPRGYVLTVRHVIARGECEVTFPGQPPVRGVVTVCPSGGVDGATLIKCDGTESFPHVEIAMTAPTRGSPVEVAGFHRGNFVRLKAHSEGAATSAMYADSSGDHLHRTSVAALAGMSGGPIVDGNNRVMSLVVMSNRGNSHGLSLSAIKQVAEFIPASPASALSDRTADKQRERLQYWWSRNCPPCAQFAKDFGPGSPHKDQLARGYDVEVFEFARNRERGKAIGITSLPAFYLPDQNRLTQGYTDPESLFAALAGEPQQPEATPPPPTFTPVSPLPDTSQAAPPLAPMPPDRTPQPPTDDEQPPVPKETTDPIGPLGSLKSWVIESVRMMLAGVVAWFMAWRAQQGFIKRRFIDRAVNKALRKARAKVDQSETGAEIVSALTDAPPQPSRPRVRRPRLRKRFR